MRYLRRGIIAAALLLSGAAQAATVVAPSQYGSTDLHGTIGTTNTFQSIQVYNSNRTGCFIQNHSLTDPMYVYFGPIASATLGGAHILDVDHGLQIECAIGGTSVAKDQVSITGTSTDAFSATFQ